MENQQLPGDVLFIGVCGGTSCGKSIVCEQIKKYIQANSDFSVNTLKMKHFYKDADFNILNHFPDGQINYDDPFMIDEELLYQTLIKLQKRQSVDVSVYKISLSQHTGEKIKIESADVIILDGIYSLYFEKIRKMLNIRIFVQSDPEQRLMSRVLYDTQKKRRSLPDIINYYQKFVQPAYSQYVEKQKKYCTNMITTNNPSSIQCILEYIQLKLAASNI